MLTPQARTSPTRRGKLTRVAAAASVVGALVAGGAVARGGASDSPAAEPPAPSSTAAADPAAGSAAGSVAVENGGQQTFTMSRSSSRAHGASKKAAGHVHDGHDGPTTRAEARQEEQERSLAMAATWHLDPKLLKALPTDSAKTTKARVELREVNRHLKAVTRTYTQAQDEAATAAEAAEEARAELLAAQQDAEDAQVRYELDKEALVSMVTTSYEQGPAALHLFGSDVGVTDFLEGMTLLHQVSNNQAVTVQDAERSADALHEAMVDVSVASSAAEDALADAEDALARATRTRTAVVADVNDARMLLEDRVLADQIQTAQMYGAAAAAAARDYVATGAKAAFPLPKGTSFVDQHNWGNRGSHWASVHTGDDFSTACGTPVLAAHAGKISILTDQSWSGPWLVMVTTGPGKLATWYAHMEALTVTDGQRVQAGQAIGLVGQAGNASGCHLHFEVHPLGGSIYEDNTDPGAWLRGVGVYPAG